MGKSVHVRPPAKDAKPGLRISGTSLTTTSEAFLKNGKRYVHVRCDCGTEKTILYHNLGRYARSCGRQCHRLSPAQRADAGTAQALARTVRPRRIQKKRSECTPEEWAAQLAYRAQTTRLSDVVEKARSLHGTVASQLYIGPVSCATPEQLAAHWAYLDAQRLAYARPTTVEQGKLYGFWQAMESHSSPTSRTRIRCLCILCNKTERPVVFRILQSPVNGGCRCTKPPVSRPSEVKPGDRFSRWVVVQLLPCKPREKLHALCKCDCGSEPRPLQVQGLLNGYSQSCGCHNIETRQERLPKGFRRGRLTVTSWLRQSVRGNGRPGDSIYLCECDCGRQTEVLSRHLNVGPTSRQRGTLSCGCLQAESNSISGTRAVSGGTIANARWLYIGKHKPVLMRSSWELAVAHKLDDLDLQWHYESKSHVLREGLRYTPDFFVPSKNKWIEVKAIVRDKHFFDKIALFRETIGPVIVLWGHDVERFVRLPIRQIHKRYSTFELRDKPLRDKIKRLIATGKSTHAILAAVKASQGSSPPA